MSFLNLLSRLKSLLPACWPGHGSSSLVTVFSALSPHFHQAAGSSHSWEQRVAPVQSRTLACLLRHRPNAYYDRSNGPLFASE